MTSLRRTREQSRRRERERRVRGERDHTEKRSSGGERRSVRRVRRVGLLRSPTSATGLDCKHEHPGSCGVRVCVPIRSRRVASRRPSNGQGSVQSPFLRFSVCDPVCSVPSVVSSGAPSSLPGGINSLLVRGHLTLDHGVVDAASRHQFLVRTALDDAAVLHQQDRSARRIVDSRCAITNVVRPASSVAIDAWISCSLSVSRLLVASSRIRICGCARIARAMASRCCCPPDSLTPRSPMKVSYPSGSLTMNSCALARRAASSISASVASCRP